MAEQQSNIDRLIAHIRKEAVYLSPVTREVLIGRIEHEPTDAEIARAREQVMGRSNEKVST